MTPNQIARSIVEDKRVEEIKSTTCKNLLGRLLRNYISQACEASSGARALEHDLAARIATNPMVEIEIYLDRIGQYGADYVARTYYAQLCRKRLRDLGKR